MFRIVPHRVLVEPKVTVEQVEGAGESATATLRIEGLLCSACAANVCRHLQAVAGVRNAQVDLETGTGRVEYDPQRAAPADLVAAVEGAVVLRPARRLLAALGGGRLAGSEH